MKFRAENFEAEVTLLDPGPGSLEWIVVAQGHKPRSIRTIGEDVQMLTDRGWKELCSTRRGNGEERVYLTEVIALLYSVPGVEYADPDEIKPTLGLCPECGAMGVSRELGPDGNDECEQGHRYPSKMARHREVGPRQMRAERHRILDEFVAAGYITEDLANNIKKSDFECT